MNVPMEAAPWKPRGSLHESAVFPWKSQGPEEVSTEALCFNASLMEVPTEVLTEAPRNKSSAHGGFHGNSMGVSTEAQ